MLGRPEPPAAHGEAGLPQVEGYEVLEVVRRGCIVSKVEGYESLEELASNSCFVCKARHKALGRLVALKMMTPHGGPEERRWFLAEAEALARLQHPNIVQIHEVCEAGGCLFFALELIHGGSLRSQLRGMPQPARAAAGLVEVLARAMDYAHRQGVLHLDLKPANILLARDGGEEGAGGGAGAPPPRCAAELLTRNPYGVPKIADFGLAARGQVPGAILGTPSYMAPEQALGEPPTTATDVYGLGAILYEMLTGRPPFQGATVQDTLEQVRGREPVPPAQLQPRVPPELNTICLHCLRKETARRYASARDLADDLRRFLAGEPISARPEGRVRSWFRRNKALAGALCLAAAALVTVAVVSFVLAVHSARSAAGLRREQENTLGALREVSEQHEMAQERTRLAEVRLAESYLDRGLALCTPGADPAAGLLWLARALESAPAEAADLQHAIRANLAAWAWDGKASAAGKGRGPVLRQSGEVGAVAFSADGRTVLTGTTRGEVLLWDVATGQALGPARREFPARDAARSPDGRLVLEVTGHRARLRYAANGNPAGPPLSHKDAVLAGAFSPDGKTVLTGSADGTAQLWDVATGKPVGPPWRHDGPVRAVAFRPDGRMAATAGNDRTARLWEVAAPVEGEAERIRLWVQVRTGRELDEHGSVRALDPDARQERARRLEGQGGPPLS
jgi:hypothetical protein